VNFIPDATDFGHFQGFENPLWVSGTYPGAPSVDWNEYNSRIARVTSGTDGIASSSGAAHGVVNSIVLPSAPDDYSGVLSRLGGYDVAFANGFTSSVDVYFDLSDPGVGASTYGWDVSTAVNNQVGSNRRDFIFHAAGVPGKILVGASNNTNYARRNDLALINHYDVTTSGWYKLEWKFRDNGSGVLAVDCNLYNIGGTLLWTETRTDPSDLIATLVGGNRYMWFTFVATEKLAIDNTSLTRKPLYTVSQASGTTFPKGTTTVTITATDACNNTGSCTFNVTVSDTELPAITCKADQIRQANSPSCTYTVSGAEFDPDSKSDNCGITTQTYTLGTGTPVSATTLAGVVFPKGNTLVTWTIGDASGNTKNCTFNVTINDTEIQVYNVTGGGQACANEPGVLVGLSDSEVGVNYQLYLGGNPVGSVVPGDGDDISFGYQTVSGTYTVKAIHAITACAEEPMTGSTVVTINPVPDATISGTATVVQNAPLTPVITFIGSGGTAPYTFTYNVNGGPVQSVSTINGNASTTVAQSNAVVGIYIYSLMSVTDANGCTKTFIPTYPTATITVILPIQVVDLAASIPRPTNTSFNFGVPKEGFVQFTNGGGSGTYGNLIFRISKVSNFDLSVPATMTTAAGSNVNNSSWTIAEGGAFWTISSTTNVINAGANTRIGFILTPSGNAGSFGLMTATVINGTGGDINLDNNKTHKQFIIN
jgi:hypothetical protein